MFRMESWDDRLGCQTHDDGTLKAGPGWFSRIMSVLLRIDLIHRVSMP